MLTIEQVRNEIIRLEGVELIRSLTNDERISLNRLRINSDYIDLYYEKDTAINENRELSWTYDVELLKLIRKILIHTRDNWQWETNEQRRGSLNNLVRAVLLLRRKFVCLYNEHYATQQERAEEVNLWRNLSFLVQCQISEQGPNINQRFNISADEVNRILREILVLVETVLGQEIRVGLRLETVLTRARLHRIEIQGYVLDTYNQHDHNVREPYRNRYALPFLNAFVSSRRELFALEKMLEAIRVAVALNLNYVGHRMALLRQLQIIGEYSTGKNLSWRTKLLVDNIDWQLFVNLRNKLSHNEWDIHTNILMESLGQDAVNIVRLQNIQQDLRQLQGFLATLYRNLWEISINDDGLLYHYSPCWFMRPETRTKLIQFTRDLMEQRIVDGEVARQFTRRLRNDIRNSGNILVNELRPSITSIFNRADPIYQHTVNLRMRFGRLVDAYNREEIGYHINRANQNRHTLHQIIAALAAYQVNIRDFNNLLNYSEDSYNHDRRTHPLSFDTLCVTNLISNEINAIRILLQPLANHDVLSLEFSEDTTDIGLVDREINLFFDMIIHVYGAVSPRTVLAINSIRNYFTLIGEPICLSIDGLHGLRRGEFGQMNITNLMEMIPDLLEPIQIFGRKCAFYTSLFYHREIIEACFYHMARIQKYIAELSDKSPGLFSEYSNKYRTLRNFINHGSDLFEAIVSTRYLHAFMSRYTSMIFNILHPLIGSLRNHITLNRNMERDFIIMYRMKERPNVEALLIHESKDVLIQRVRRLSI